MSSLSSMNKNNSAVKRIMQEARELANDPSTDYSAAPLEDDIFEWHCTLRGPPGTEFEGGLYHFRILLPAEYPFRPPSLMMLTPNGRFELNTKICISFTNYHEELWQPAWGVRTAIIGLQGFFPLKGQAAVGVGSIEHPASERRRLAKLSRDWVCPHCDQSNVELLPDPSANESQSNSNKLGSASDSDLPQSTQGTSDPSSHRLLASNLEDSQTTLDHDNHPQTEIQFVDTASSSAPEPLINHAAAENRGERLPLGIRSASQRVPLILDGVICFLLALVFAMLYKRVF